MARHERVAGKYAEVLLLDHYLEVLGHKPGAFPGSTALAQARAAGSFTPPTNGSGTRPAGSTATRTAPGR